MNGTIIQQGRFTSTGEAELIEVRSDIDWMEIYNTTVADDDTQTTAVGVQYYWQRGMASDRGIEYRKSNAANAAQLTTFVASGGFTLIDPNAGPEAAVTGTTITKANPAVCTAASHGYNNGDQVALTNLVEMDQIGVVVFTIGSVTTNTFELSFMDTNTANFTTETAFVVRKLAPFQWNNGFNYISSITSGATTSVVLTSDDVSASYVVGDIITFNVTSDFGMTEIDGLQGEITSYTAATNTYVVDIDSTSFTAFAWPAASAVPLTHPQVQLVGTNSSSILGATTNTTTLDMRLAAGADSPAGSTSDVIFWRAGKSFSVTNN